jgi:hypothetical protein
MGRALAESLFGAMVEFQHAVLIAQHEARRREREATEPKKALSPQEREQEKIAIMQRKLAFSADTRRPQ